MYNLCCWTNEAVLGAEALLFVIPLTVLTHLHNPAAVVGASNKDGARVLLRRAATLHIIVPHQVFCDTDEMPLMFFSTSGCDRLILARSLTPRRGSDTSCDKVSNSNFR